MTDDLISDIKTFIRRFVVMDDDQLLVTSVWVLHTHALGAAVQTPYLAITSPEKQCGKTRLLETLELLVHEPWMVTLPSEATMYRKVDQQRPTMLLDELDTMFNTRQADKYEGHRALLNSGNRRGVVVSRCLGASNELVDFEVFCAKALAGISSLPDTVADRSIPIRLKRRVKSETVERLIHRDVEPDANALRDRCKEWALDHIDALSFARPKMPDELSDRAVEGCEILVAIADEFEIGDDLRDSLVKLFNERVDDRPTAAQRLLRDCYRVFGTDTTLPSKILAAKLNALEDAKWASYSRGAGISMSDIAGLLRDYKIHSTTVRHVDHEGKSASFAGYRRLDFEEHWQRYLDDSVTDVTDVTQD